jgi:hypothetical protein
MSSIDVTNKLNALINRAETMLLDIPHCGSEFTAWKNDVLIIVKRALPEKESKKATFERAMAWGGSINGYPSQADYYKSWLTDGVAIIKSWKKEIEDFGVEEDTKDLLYQVNHNENSGSFDGLMQGIAFGTLLALSAAYYACIVPWEWLFRQNNKGFILISFSVVIVLCTTWLYDKQHRKVLLKILVIPPAIYALVEVITWVASVF